MINIGSTAGRRLFCVNPGSVQSCSLDQIYILIAGGRKPLCKVWLALLSALRC